jgi:hypothetical protein
MIIVGIIAAVIVTAAGSGNLALPAFIAGFLSAAFFGGPFSISIRIGKSFWIRHRR